MVKASFTFLLFAAQASLSEASIGDQLARVYTSYIQQPLTASQASDAGFKRIPGSSCDPTLGYAYSKEFDDSSLRGSGSGNVGASSSSPTQLYYSAAGQLTGLSTDVYGDVEQTPFKMGYFDQIGDDHYRISVGFRSDTSGVCDPDAAPYSDPVGDVVIVQPNGIAVPIPLTEAEAIATNQYHKGSCFDGMGYHYFLDLKTDDNSMSWTSDGLSPVVVMYNIEGDINAIFFASSDVQQGMFSTNEWEPVPLPEFAMCGNFCDRDTCTFKGNTNGMWSTMHFYFKDYKQVTCTDWGKMDCHADPTGWIPTPGLACCAA